MSTKIAKAMDEFARYLACKPHVWAWVNKGKPDQYGGVTRRCKKCKVRETSYPDRITTRWPNPPKVALRR